MTPNLRFNKKMTKKLIASTPKENLRKNRTSLDWSIENTDNIYGSCYQGLFKVNLFIIQKKSEDMYRLIVADNKGLCGFYIIDDIEEYLDFIGVEELEFDNQKEIAEAIKETVNYPNTGIVNIDGGKIFVYEHKDQ